MANNVPHSKFVDCACGSRCSLVLLIRGTLFVLYEENHLNESMNVCVVVVVVGL